MRLKQVIPTSILLTFGLQLVGNIWANQDSPHHVYVCEREAAQVYYFFKRGHSEAVKVFVNKLSPDESHVTYKIMHEQGTFVDRRAWLTWETDDEGDKLSFKLHDTILSDAGTYGIYVYWDGSFKEHLFTFIVIKTPACPDRDKIKRPTISYWTKGTSIIPIDDGKLELSEPVNVTLLVEMPPADPPVECLISAYRVRHTCNGTLDSDSYCELGLFLGKSPFHVVNVTLTFVAYASWTTQIYVQITEDHEPMETGLQEAYAESEQYSVIALPLIVSLLLGLISYMCLKLRQKPMHVNQVSQTTEIEEEEMTPVPPRNESRSSLVNEETGRDGFLDDETRERINRNRIYIIQNLNATPCIAFLHFRGFINTETFDDLESKKSTPLTQILSLLDLVRRSTSMFNAFLLALRNSNQNALVDRLSLQDPAAAVVAGNSTLLGEIKDRHYLIIDNLRFEDNLLTRLEGRGVVTTAQVEDIQTEPTRREKAQRLLNLLKKGETVEKISEFVSAMHETDQRHIALLIESGDDSDIISEKFKKVGQRHKLSVIEEIRKQVKCTSLPSVLSILEKNNTVSVAQSAIIQAAGSPEVQYQLLVEIILCRPWSVVRHYMVTDSRTNHLTFSIPALHGAHADKQRSQYTQYTERLASSVKVEAIKRNKQLNEKFGINLEKILYCDLAMAAQLRHLPDHWGETSNVEEYVRRTAESFQFKDTISIDTIFESVDAEEEPKRVLLLGGAGMGKTTVLQEQARRWADRELKTPDIMACYRFECRNFTNDINKKKESSLAELLSEQYGPGYLSEKDRKSLTKFIIQQESDILISIDGLDELADWKSCERNAPLIYDVKKQGEVHHIIYNLIHRRLLPNSKVIVTTRPISSVKQHDFEKCLIALGFSKESIKQCMRALCQHEKDGHELSQNVIEYIEQTNLVSDCVVPLTCILLGVLLRRDLSPRYVDKPPPIRIDSMTRLYIRVIIRYIWLRVEEETESWFNLSKKQIATLLKLAKLAANGMCGEETSIIFSNVDLEAVDMKPDEGGFGLLEITRTVDPDYPIPCTANFLHLTIQEFLAALHIALTWDAALVEKLSKPGSQRLDMVSMFVCGLTGDPEGTRFLRVVDPVISDQTAKSRSLELLMNISPKEDTLCQALKCLAKVGLTAGDLDSPVEPQAKVGPKETHFVRGEEIKRSTRTRAMELLTKDSPSRQQLLSCMMACKLGLQIKPKDDDLDRFRDVLSMINPIDPYLARAEELLSINSLAHLTVVRCISEGKLESIVGKLEGRLLEEVNGLQNLDLCSFPGGLLPHHLAAVGYTIQSSSVSGLLLQGCQISSEGIQSLVRSCPRLTGLKRLGLGINSLADAGIELLAPLLRQNRELENLSLRNNCIGDAGVKIIAGLMKCLPRMQSLSLWQNEISDAGAKALADALLKHPEMKTLYLRNNNISDVGAEYLARLFRENTKIEYLSLYKNKLSVETMIKLKEEFGSRIDVASDFEITPLAPNKPPE